MHNIYMVVTLLGFTQSLAYNIDIERGITDKFSPIKQCSECNIYKGYCEVSAGSCCEKCSCDHGVTFFKKDSNFQCVRDVAHPEGCYYHLQGSENPSQQASRVNLISNADIKVGVIVPTGKRLGRLSDCYIVGNRTYYWNLMEWKHLFAKGRKKEDFSIKYTRRDASLNFQVNSDHSASLYHGFLIKLDLGCKDKRTKEVKESCLMFKVDGKMTYLIEKAVSTTMMPMSTPVVASKPADNKFHHVIIIISISIFLAAVFISTIILFICRRKYRKSTRSKEAYDPNHSKKLLLRETRSVDDGIIYQTPKTGIQNGKQQSQKDEGIGDYQNPDDIPFSKKSEKTEKKMKKKIKEKKKLLKKQDEYDYPEIEVIPLSKSAKEKKKLSAQSKHEYAEVSVDDCTIPNHPYTDPDKFLDMRKPKLGHSAGYASIDEPYSIDQNTPKSRGYASIDDKESPAKAPVERYASLNLSVDGESSINKNNGVPYQSQNKPNLPPGYASIDESDLSKKPPLKPRYASLNIDDGSYCSGNESFGNQGYASLDATTVESPKYFEIEEKSSEKGENERESVYFELEGDVAI